VTPARPVVAGVGDVGLDVLVRPDGPVAVGSDTRSDVRLTQGGAGANTAAWLVACGADGLLIGRVGADEPAGLVRSALARAGVWAALAVDDRLPTCCVVVLVDRDGVRTMLPSRGASGALSAADVAAVDLSEVDHLHLSGYVLLDSSSRAAGLAALDLARRAGLTTSVDPQAAALLGDPTQFLSDIRGIDLLLPNEDELVALTGGTGVAAARQLLGHVGAVACTAGERGATWVDQHGTAHAPAVPTTVVDPTGAGDAFNAGLLAAWLGGVPPEEALRGGVRAGANAVATLGARPVAAPGTG
jgi:sugar/nucleoside kinase (ribokinase family)